MAQFLLTITTVEQRAQLASFTIQHVVNGPDFLEAEIQDADGSLVIAMDDVVELTDVSVSPAVTKFKGIVDTTKSRSWTGHGFGRIRKITAFDYSIFASFATATIEVGTGSPADSVESVLQRLVNDYLTDYGVTLHPSQTLGPTVEANGFENVSPEFILNALSEQTGWVWKIDDQLRLRMWNPSTEAAAQNVTATNGSYVTDIPSEQYRRNYANRVFVSGGNGYTESILNETHAGDGALRVFPMNAPMHYFEVDYTSTLGFPVGLTVFVHRTGGTTIEYANDAETAEWKFNRGPSYSLEQVSGATLGSTESIEIPGYSARWPMTLVADGRGSPPAPPRDLRLSRPWMFGRQAIQALADEVLSASQVDLEQVVYPSTDLDLSPGQTLTINVPEAGLNDSYTVVSAQTYYVDDGDTTAFRREITAVNSVTARSFWLDVYRRWLEDNEGVATETTMAPVTAQATVPPTLIPTPTGAASSTLPGGSNKQIQFNDFGRFGGAANAEFDKALEQFLITSGLTSNSAIGMSTYGSEDYQEMVFGARSGSVGYKPAKTAMNLSAFSADAFGAGQAFYAIAQIYRGMTANTDQSAPAIASELGMGGLIGGTYKNGVLVLKRVGATGAEPGSVFVIQRNTAGSGAPGCLCLESMDGSQHFLWFTNAGVLRHGTAPPEEDGTPAEGSGTAV